MTDRPSPWEDPSWLEYAEHARNDMLPKMKGSAITLALVPEGNDVDPKMACELGYMIMLDKPILAIVQPGTKVPNNLVKVATEIVEMGESMDDPAFQQRMAEALRRMQVPVPE